MRAECAPNARAPAHRAVPGLAVSAPPVPVHCASMGLFAWIACRRARRRAADLAQYEHLSDAERAELERLREQQSPLGRLAGARGGSAWARMVERDFRPRR